MEEENVEEEGEEKGDGVTDKKEEQETNCMYPTVPKKGPAGVTLDNP